MPHRRRTFSKSFKVQVVQECSEPGASMAHIALGYSLNINLVQKWIRLHKSAIDCFQPECPALHPESPGAGSYARPSGICREI